MNILIFVTFFFYSKFSEEIITPFFSAFRCRLKAIISNSFDPHLYDVDDFHYFSFTSILTSLTIRVHRPRDYSRQLVFRQRGCQIWSCERVGWEAANVQSWTSICLKGNSSSDQRRSILGRPAICSWGYQFGKCVANRKIFWVRKFYFNWLFF